MILHFIRPHWLLALVPICLYLGWVFYKYKTNNPWEKICDSHLLTHLVKDDKQTSTLFFHFLLFLLFTIAIFASAGPAWKQIPLPIYRETNSTLLVLDLSPGMEESDLTPDRLTRAKLKIRDLIDSAKNSQMGLVVFSEESFVVSPLSKDAKTLNVLLDELNPNMLPISGINISAGLKEGHRLLAQGEAVSHGSILLITSSEPSEKDLGVARQIFKEGYHINVFAMLTDDSNHQVQINKLKQLANNGGGEFILFNPDGTDIKKILSLQQDKRLLRDENMDTSNLWQDEGPWFCLFLLPIALIVIVGKVLHENLD